MNDYHKYFSMSYPAALFDMKYVMNAANKPALADAMWALMPQYVQGLTMCMLLMVVHYSIEFHGTKEVHTIAFVRNTLTM